MQLMHLQTAVCLAILALRLTDATLNVLLIVVDDLRPTLGAYGDKLLHTPNVDALASKSTIFNRAYAQQALCAPSRNSFLTSRRPDTTRLYDFYSYWRDAAGNFTTLPQHFTENGYDSYSIGKVFHPGVSSNFSDDSRFSWSMRPFHPSTVVYTNAPVCSSSDGVRRQNLLCPVDVASQPEQTLPDIQSRHEAVRFLGQRSSRSDSKPFFLAVGLHKPHVPFKFPERYLSLYPLHKVPLPSNPDRPALMPDIAWNPWQSLRIRADIAALNLSFPYGPMPALHSRLIRQHYYASVSYIDDQIGSILRGLIHNGLANSTIVALVGDHGWSLGEHQEWAKFSNFEVAVRVPWILHLPTLHGSIEEAFKHKSRSFRSPKDIIAEPVELLDLFPTLVDLAGLPTIPRCPKDSRGVRLCTDGRSRARRLRGRKKVEPSFAFSQYPRPSIHPTLDSDQPHLKNIAFMGYSVRSERYRCTEWVEFDHRKFRPNWDSVVALELYNHDSDPDENYNEAGSLLYKEVARQMRQLIRKQFSRR